MAGNTASVWQPDHCRGAASCDLASFWSERQALRPLFQARRLKWRTGMKMTGFLLTLLLSACGPWVNATALNPSPRTLSSRSAGSVDVYSSGPPARPHVDVALLEVGKGDDNSGGTSQMIQTLRQKAADMGCDGVVVGGMTTRARSGHVPFDFGDRTVHGTCIVYKIDALEAEGPPAVAEPREAIPRAPTPEVLKDLDQTAPH
jgi:hypothetical protein